VHFIQAYVGGDGGEGTTATAATSPTATATATANATANAGGYGPVVEYADDVATTGVLRAEFRDWWVMQSISTEQGACTE
jgi:hypothetical protein